MLADITLSAQTDNVMFYRHEISANVGFGTLSGNRWDAFREQMEERFALSFRHGHACHTTPLGVHVGLRYIYSFNKHIAIGAQFPYFKGVMTMTTIQRKKKEEIAPNAFRIANREYDNPPSIQAKAFSIMPMVKWLYSKYFYVRGGLGF